MCVTVWAKSSWMCVFDAKNSITFSVCLGRGSRPHGEERRAGRESLRSNFLFAGCCCCSSCSLLCLSLPSLSFRNWFMLWKLCSHLSTWMKRSFLVLHKIVYTHSTYSVRKDCLPTRRNQEKYSTNSSPTDWRIWSCLSLRSLDSEKQEERKREEGESSGEKRREESCCPLPTIIITINNNINNNKFILYTTSDTERHDWKHLFLSSLPVCLPFWTHAIHFLLTCCQNNLDNQIIHSIHSEVPWKMNSFNKFYKVSRRGEMYMSWNED